jgi:hypothetical protein
VTELGAAGGRGLAIDHLINIEGSFTSNGAPRLGTLRRSQAGAAMSVSVVVGPVTSPMSLLQGDEDEHADPAPVTAEPQETRSRLAVSSAGIYLPTTATTTTWGDWFTRRNTDRQRDRLIQQLAGLGYYVTLNKIV